ncbi:MAG: lysoplasmalogenase [Oceanicaulis sp.]|nr:lysoplasmalogenase [Oceanicaulis sp.]
MGVCGGLGDLSGPGSDHLFHAGPGADQGAGDHLARRIRAFEAGASAGFGADAVSGRRLCAGDEPAQLEAGIGFFGAAHLTYIAIFALMVVSGGLKREGLVLAGGLFVFGVAMWLWLSPGMGALTVPVSLYLGIILVMAMAAGLVKGPNLIVIGALLFVVSDSVIAMRWFGDVLVFEDSLDWGGVIVWVTYYAAQLCLTLGVLRARAGAKAQTVDTEVSA